MTATKPLVLQGAPRNVRVKVKAQSCAITWDAPQTNPDTPPELSVVNLDRAGSPSP